MRRYRAIITATAMVAVVGAAAPVLASPENTVAVTPVGTSTHHDQVQLVAGAANWLLYVSRPYVTIDAQNGDSSPASPSLMVRSAAGQVTNLGSAQPLLETWSIAGSFAVAGLVDAFDNPLSSVEVINLRTGHRQTVALDSPHGTIQAPPAGFVYVVGGDSLRSWNATTGTYEDWGTPFPGQTLSSLITNATGLVVTGSTSGVALMSYDNPAHFTALDSAGATFPSCRALNEQGAACDLWHGDESNLAFVPLDGSGPTVSNSGGEFSQVALSGDEVLWTDPRDGDTHLLGFSAGRPVNTQSADYIDDHVVSAYGKAVFRSLTADGAILEASKPENISTTFVAPRSPETAGSFTLTSNGIVYVSDLRDAGDPMQTTRLRSVEVHRSGNQIRLGTPHDTAGRRKTLQVQTALYPLADPLDSTVAATTDAAAYVVKGWVQGARHLSLISRLMVATHGRHFVVPDSGGSSSASIGDLQAAGHRIMFARSDQIFVYDVKTGKTQFVRLGHSGERLALAAKYLSSISSHGVVRRLNLRTGKTITIYTPPNPRPSEVAVVAKGDRVAWSIRPDRPVGSVPLFGMRDMSTGIAEKLPHEPYAMTADGVLLHGLWRSNGVMTWYRPFGGKVRPLLQFRNYTQLPQLVGRTLAWVSVDGNLKVAPYRY